MKVSVVMCTYNGEKYITEQLDSLKNQTRRIDEVIICDDCSADKTANIIRNYINKNNLKDRWYFYENTKNKGYADNFHAALMMTTGDIIFLCDQDDVWHLKKIEYMISMFKNDMSVLYSEHHDFKCADQRSDNRIYDIEKIRIKKIDFDSDSMYLQAPGCAMVVSRQFLLDANPYWYSGFAHDEFIWKIALCIGNIYCCNLNLVERRIHDLNTSNKKMRSKQSRREYIYSLQKSYEAMEKAIRPNDNELQLKTNLISHNLESCKLRLQMIETKKMRNLVVLFLKYRDTVKTWKSFLADAFYGLGAGK